MRNGRYKSLFPGKYVDLWERQMRYHMGRVAHRNLKSHQEAFLREWRQLRPNAGLLDGLLYLLLWLSTRVAALTAFCCVLVRYFPWPGVRRRLHRHLPHWARWMIWEY
jgi:hypothetical protein